jgi:site-specific DNA-methyltransferase (cytosine-N4-specific)
MLHNLTSVLLNGLRSYNTEPQIWGNHNGCSHVWKTEIKPAANGLVNNVMQGETLDGNSATRRPTEYAFCRSCNAWKGELGSEPTFQLYTSHLIEIFAEVKRVLKKDGTCFVNLGDSYTGSGKGGHSDEKRSDNWKPTYPKIAPVQKTAAVTTFAGDSRTPDGLQSKCLMNIPARFAIAMTDELQMIQRNEIIWYKRACMPSSAKDRFTVDFEKIFFFAKSPKYKFNQQVEPTAPITPIRLAQNVSAQAGSAIQGGGYHEPMKAVGDPENRNKRCVWDVPFEPQSEEHYASYPTKLVEPMILAGTDEGDTVLDIFSGTGTTLLTALRHRRSAIGIELQPKYVEIARRRLAEVQVKLF